MKLKTLACVSLLCLPALAQPVKAQWRVGGAAGWNKNYLHASTQNRPFTKYDPLNGFAFSAPVQYHFSSWFALQADPGIIRKSYQLTRTGIYSGIYHQQKNLYVQLPLMARFSFGGQKLKGFLNMGGYAAWWAGARLKGLSPDFYDYRDLPSGAQYERFLDVYGSYTYNEKYAWNSQRDRRLELGVLAGLGVSYELNGNSSIFAEGRYYRSLTDMQKNYMIGREPRFNDTFVLQAGYMFQLKRKDKQTR